MKERINHASYEFISTWAKIGVSPGPMWVLGFATGINIGVIMGVMIVKLGL